MKIYPISALSNRYIGKNQSPANIPASTPYDSVSFGSVKNLVEIAKAELKDAVSKEIDPFLADAKESLRETGFIGYKAQEKLKIFDKEEKAFLMKKFYTAIPQNSSYFSEIAELASKYETLQKNKRYFKALSKIGNGDLLGTAEIRAKISETEPIIFDKNPFVEKVANLAEKIEDTYEQIKKNSAGITLEQQYPKMYDTKKKLSEQKDRAIYYVFRTPIKEAAEIKLGVNALNDPKNKPDNIMKTYETVETLQRRIYELEKEKAAFYENKDEINEFVQNNKKTPLPSDSSIKDAYSNLNKTYDDMVDNGLNELAEYFRSEFKNEDLNRINKSLNGTIAKQEKALAQLDKLVSSARQSYIEKRNLNP